MNTVLDNLVIVYNNGSSIDISRTLPYSDHLEFFKKHEINFEHYRDACYRYHNDIIGWCSRYSRYELYNGNILKDEILKLLTEFTNKFNKIYPDKCTYVGYSSMFNKITVHSYYHHGGSYIFDEYAKYFCDGTKGVVIPIKSEMLSIISKAIKSISKHTPDKIEPLLGKTYKLTRDTEIFRFILKKGSIFKVIHNGDSWCNHTLIELISGEVALTVHSSFFSSHTVNINEVCGNKNIWYNPELFKKIMGVELSSLSLGYDPYGVGGYIPCEEIH